MLTPMPEIKVVGQMVQLLECTRTDGHYPVHYLPYMTMLSFTSNMLQIDLVYMLSYHPPILAGNIPDPRQLFVFLLTAQ